MISPKGWSMLAVVSSVTVCLLLAWSPAHSEDLSLYAFRDLSHQADSPGSWATRLNFSAPVFLANLNQALSVTVDGKKIHCKISAVGAKNREQSSRSFLVAPTRIDPFPETVTIKIAKTLTDVLGVKTLSSPFVYEFQSVEEISVKGLETFSRSELDRGLQILLPGSASTKDVLKAIKINPKVSGLKIRRNDEGQFEVSGNFVKDRNYKIQFVPVTTNNGSAIFAQSEFEFKGPGLNREIAFYSDHSIVELKSRQFVPIKLSGVSEVKCELQKVPLIFIPETVTSLKNQSENIQQGLDSRKTSLSKIKTGSMGEKFVAADFQEDSDVFFSPGAKDRSLTFSAPLSFRKSPDKGGAWIVKFTDPDNSKVAPVTELIQITDLALSYKISAQSLLVWVTSLYSGEPVPGVSLGAVTTDGKVYDIGKSDENGLALVKQDAQFQHFELRSDKKSSDEPGALSLDAISWLIATTKDDYAAVDINAYRIKAFPTKTTENGNQAFGSRSGYMFTDRGIYRPGDEVNFKFISRIFKDHKIMAPEGARVKTQITGPRGDVYYSREQVLDEFGACYDTLKLEPYWPVGNYTIKTAFDDDPEGKKAFTRDFAVQEYRESRHFVSLSFQKEQKKAPTYLGTKAEEELLVVEVTASYFAGGPVRHGKVRWKAELGPVTHNIPGYESYFFGNQEDRTLFLESGESILDDQGKLSLRIPLDARILTGIYGVKLSATVVDIDGQPATDVKFFNPIPKFLVGIGAHPSQVQVGYANPLNFVLIDSEGKKIPKGLVEISLLQKRYLNVKKRDSQGNINDSWEEGWIKTFSTKQTVLDGKGTFQPELIDPGDYLVAITIFDASSRYSSQTLFKVGWEDYDQWLQGQKDSSKGPNANVLVALNQKVYVPDTPIEATFHTPREVKKCLLTLERNDILDHQVVEMNGQDGGGKFLIRKGYQPNVFVSLLAPAGRTNLPVYTSQTDSDIPAVFSGYANASVKTDFEKLRLEINKNQAHLKAAPGEKVTLNLEVLNQSGSGVYSEIAVCVVNEAVLAMTDFSIPELSSLGNFDLPLTVKTGDIRLGLISQDLFKTLTTRPLTGGGVGKALMGPTFRKDFRPVAYFNPAVITDKNGKASVTFSAPDSLTSYRIFAVATDKSSGFVSADRNMLVTKDFYVDPSLPRFLCPGDRAVVPISVFNNTKEKGSVDLRLNSSANLNLKPHEFKLDSEGNSSKVVQVDAKLEEQSEETFLEIVGMFDRPGQKLQDAVRKIIPTRDVFTPVTQSYQGNFTKITQIPVNLPEALRRGVLDKKGTPKIKGSLTLSLSDWSRIMPGLNYLMQYPYGCIEQISSSVIPLASIRSLIDSGVISELSKQKVDDFLKNGLDKILGSQQLTGGFSYWPGQLETSVWGSTYATFALINAKNAGMTIPEANLNLAAKFLKESAFKKHAAEGDYRTQSDRYWALLALADLNAVSGQDLQPFFSDYGRLPEESKALLLLASKKIGYLDQTRSRELIKELIASDDSIKKASQKSSWRSLAACLMATLQIEGRSKKADELAGIIMSGLKPEGRWVSTADTSWCLLALSDYYKQKSLPNVREKAAEIVISYAERPHQKITLKETSATIELDPVSLLKTDTLTIKTNSDEFVNYCLSISYPEESPIQQKGPIRLKLTKKIDNLNGRNDINVGDIVRISLQIQLEDDKGKRANKALDFLALEDFTPAGLTPVNTELKTEGLEGEALPDDSSDESGLFEFYPTYVEIRDDGIRVFKNRIYGGLYKFSYLARAVTAGKFWMRGSTISAMYEPDVRTSIPGQEITVQQSSR
jgi:uncharacterized protein YfaS (alpha-2-macroglobulin family)